MLKKIAKNAAKFSVGGIANSIIGTLGLPLLIISYSPAQFGAYSLYLYALGVIVTFSTLRLEMLIASEKSNNGALSFLMSGVFFALFISVLSVSFACILLLINIIEITSLQLLFVFSYIFGQSFITLITSWHVKEGEFIFAGLIGLTLTTSTLIFQLLFSDTNNGLFSGSVVGVAITALLVVLYKNNYLQALLINKDIRYKNISPTLNRHKKILFQNIAQSFLNSSSLAILSLGVSQIGGESAVGYFSLVQKILIQPVRILGGSIKQSMLNGFSKMEYITRYRIAKKSTFVIAPASIVIFIVFDSIFFIALERFGTSTWQPANAYIVPLSIWLTMTVTYIPAIAWLNTNREVWPHLYYELSNLFFRTFFLGLAVFFQFNVITYVWVACISSFILALLFCSISFSRYIKYESS